MTKYLKAFWKIIIYNPFYEISKETNQIKELSLYSFEEILSVKMARADISYRKYELDSARYLVLRVNHITKWF